MSEEIRTVGWYRAMCAALGGEDCRAVAFFDKRITADGDGTVVADDSQMMALLGPMLMRDQGAVSEALDAIAKARAWLDAREREVRSLEAGGVACLDVCRFYVRDGHKDTKLGGVLEIDLQPLMSG